MFSVSTPLKVLKLKVFDSVHVNFVHCLTSHKTIDSSQEKVIQRF